MYVALCVFRKNWVRDCGGYASARLSVQRKGYSPSVQQQYKQLIICTQNVQFCSAWPKSILPTKQSPCKIDACLRNQVKSTGEKCQTRNCQHRSTNIGVKLKYTVLFSLAITLRNFPRACRV
jgi:hypothetical protein